MTRLHGRPNLVSANRLSGNGTQVITDSRNLEEISIGRVLAPWRAHDPGGTKERTAPRRLARRSKARGLGSGASMSVRGRRYVRRRGKPLRVAAVQSVWCSLAYALRFRICTALPLRAEPARSVSPSITELPAAAARPL